ncbi:MAG: hypothetical protein U0Y96_13760 [Candidatus Kapaibacterium sp.]
MNFREYGKCCCYRRTAPGGVSSNTQYLPEEAIAKVTRVIVLKREFFPAEEVITVDGCLARFAIAKQQAEGTESSPRPCLCDWDTTIGQ